MSGLARSPDGFDAEAEMDDDRSTVIIADHSADCAVEPNGTMSVCLSHSSIVAKRLNTSSNFFGGSSVVLVVNLRRRPQN